MSADKFGNAQHVGDVTMSGSGHKVDKFTEVKNPGRTITVLLRGSNELVLAEANRSIHDAQCVVRSLVKKRFLIAGGSTPGGSTPQGIRSSNDRDGFVLYQGVRWSLGRHTLYICRERWK